MIRTLRRAGPLLLALVAACQPVQPADLVFTGGRIVTMDSAAPRAEALAIRADRIIWVGTDQGASQWIGPATTVVPLDGRTVLPGFQDAHIHPVSGGMALGACDLEPYRTAAEVLAHVAECAAKLPPGAWLVGGSWQLPVFPGARPGKELLDRIVPDRLAYLRAADGHSAWVNSAALRAAGITARTPDPENGRIERDAAGEPMGTLREAAMGLVSKHLPAPTLAERVAGLRRAVPLLNAAGVTAFQEAAAGREHLEAYRELERQGGLTARAVISMTADPGAAVAQADSFVAWRREFTSPRISPTAVKFFADGVIEAHTAALLAPYTGLSVAGAPNWSTQAFDSMMTALVERGFSIHVHAIGDRAVRMTLDAIGRADPGPDRGSRRHQIAHVQLVDSADVARFGTIGVIANFQPLWAIPDSYIRDLTWPVLGPERSRWLYPIGAVARAGGRIAFGSDWKVSSLVPLEGIQVAVTRQDPADSLGEQLLPEQAIDLDAALEAYTMGSAYALGLEATTGSLAPGKAADLIVLDADLSSVPAHRIGRTRVVLTLLDGVPVHGALAELRAGGR
jgi:hypothetical protein